MGLSCPWALAAVAPTVIKAISAKVMHVKDFSVVGMCMSSIANRIRKQENRKVCAAFRSIKLGSASQDVVACVHHRGFFRARKGDCDSAGLGDRWAQLVAAVAGRESLPAPRSATNSSVRIRRSLVSGLRWPLWVKSRHLSLSQRCPLYPESGHGA